jgi:hypothetical protein
MGTGCSRTTTATPPVNTTFAKVIEQGEHELRNYHPPSPKKPSFSLTPSSRVIKPEPFAVTDDSAFDPPLNISTESLESKAERLENMYNRIEEQLEDSIVEDNFSEFDTAPLRLDSMNTLPRTDAFTPVRRIVERYPSDSPLLRQAILQDNIPSEERMLEEVCKLEEEVNIFDALPFVLQMKVLSHMTIQELYPILFVNKHWNSLTAEALRRRQNL